MATCLRVEEGGVFHATVFELFLPQVWKDRRVLKKELSTYFTLTASAEMHCFLVSACPGTCVIEDGVFNCAVLKECVG